MVVPISQKPRTRTANAIRRPLTSSRWLVRARARARAPAVLASSACAGSLRDAALRALIAHEYLVPEVVPDLVIDPRALGFEADLRHIPLARQVDAVDTHLGARSGPDDNAAGRQRDR